MTTFADVGIDIPFGRTSGKLKTTCPQCRDNRAHPSDKSLSVNIDLGVWKCHHCGWTGGLKQPTKGERPMAAYRKIRQKTAEELSLFSPKAIAWFLSRGISQATLLAMKVSEGMAFMPQRSMECNTVQFNYYVDGELVNTKYRTGDKLFKMEAGARLVPYNIDAIKGTKECIITEGEMDALSFYEAGRHDVVSVPNGANKNLTYLDDFIDSHFDDKEIIYIASDTDAKGTELKDELLRRLGADVCRVVTYGDGCKDANEHLLRYGKDSLLQCLANAPETKISGIVYEEDIDKDVDDLFVNGLPTGEGIGHATFDSLCRFEAKRLCIVTGIPSSGKSEFIDEITTRLSFLHGWRFAYFTPENTPLQLHVAKLISKITGKDCSAQTRVTADYAKAKAFVNDNFFYIDPQDDYKLSTILDKAKAMVRRRGIRGLVIDPYNYLDDDSNGISETKHINRQLDTLVKFARRYGILVILMAHPTKMQRDSTGATITPTLYDISGSAHFYNRADYGLVVHRNKRESTVSIIVSKMRWKNLGREGEAKFKYNIANGRYVPCDDINVPVAWNNDSYFDRPIEQEQQADDIEDIDDDIPF